MDWEKCVLCQAKSDYPLVDPASNKNAKVCGYTNLTNNIEEFQKCKVPFPSGILECFNELTQGEGILHNLKQRRAKWHKNCALELSASK